MAVRRLAAESMQPGDFAFTPENAAWAKGQIAKYPPGRQASAVLPLLWRAQTQHDYWLPKPAIEAVAAMLDMPFIRVLEIATFYSMFNLEPVGRHFVQLCGTTPCVLRGAAALKDVCRDRIGDEHHVSADGKFSWLEVECLGACCNAPMVQINDDYYEDLTPENFNKLLDDLAAGHPVQIGSQVGRRTSEPEPGKATALNDPALYDGSVVGAWRKRFDEEADRAKAKADAERPSGAVASPPDAKKKPAEGERKTPEPEKKADVPALAPAAGKLEAAETATATTSAAQHAVDSKAAASVEGLSAAPAQTPAAPASPAPREPESRPSTASAAAQHAVDSRALATSQGDQAPTAQADRPLAQPAEAAVDAEAGQRADSAGQRPKALSEPRDGSGDDLRQIVGIGTANHKRLNGLGVFHYDQIAGWTAENMAWMSAYLGFPGRVERDEWVAQAQDLSAGKPPRDAVGEAARGAAPPTPLGGPPAAAPVAQILAQTADDQELNEAQRAAEATVVAAKLNSMPTTATPEERADAVGQRPAALSAPRGGLPDDLKRIRGIGVVNETRLRELGIFHFDQIAAWARPQVNWVGAYLAFPGRIDRETWVAQARALAAGRPAGEA